MTLEDRLAQLERALAGMPWDCVAAEVKGRIEELTQQLITQNNDETRGRIKALQDLLDLPVALQQEREGLTAALSDQDAANN
jgi:DNA anti-recombination protein RmuC